MPLLLAACTGVPHYTWRQSGREICLSRGFSATGFARLVRDSSRCRGDTSVAAMVLRLGCLPLYCRMLLQQTGPPTPIPAAPLSLGRPNPEGPTERKFWPHGALGVRRQFTFCYTSCHAFCRPLSAQYCDWCTTSVSSVATGCRCNGQRPKRWTST